MKLSAVHRKNKLEGRRVWYLHAIISYLHFPAGRAGVNEWEVRGAVVLVAGKADCSDIFDTEKDVEESNKGTATIKSSRG